MHITQVLRRAVQIAGDREATAMEGRRHTYRQLVDRVARLAGALRAKGIATGDRVAILALNSDRYLEYYFAVWWLGAVVVPLNSRWAIPEHEFALADSGAKALFVDAAFGDTLAPLSATMPAGAPLVFMGDTGQPEGALNHDRLIDDHAPVADADAGGDDLAGIFYTGGTTGRAKGVMLSHRNLVYNAINAEATFGYGAKPRYLHAAPMFHAADLMNLMPVTVKGGHHTFLSAFDPAAVLQLLRDEAVNVTLLVPTMVNMVVNHPEASAFGDLACKVVYGASPMPEAVLRKGIETFPAWTFIQAYGMTELSPLAAALMWDEHVLEGDRAVQLAACGRSAVGCDMRIVDSDGTPLPVGEIGEIAVRSDNVMRGYWNRPDLTAETVKNGWMMTGDAAHMDGHGFIYIVDRVKDMIISGGENVYSAEVEQAVYSHPAVLECAVIGVPDDKWGERVHAVVRLHPGVQAEGEDIMRHCRGVIGAYKCPRSVSFTDQALPLSGAGKILKTELRKPFWEGHKRAVG